jgi:tRNA (cmo5U34)-methyltransferase
MPGESRAAELGVGDGIALTSDSWNFDQAAAHFDRHVSRSVPQLEEQREYVARLARFFAHDGARIYELGVSTGRLAETVLRSVAGRRISYVGLDISSAMAARARANLEHDPRFCALEADVLQFPFEPAALVLSYYTLQFLPVARREELLRRVHAALQPGGALVLYEKTLAGHPLVQDMQAQLYAEFKLAQGFAPEEVLNKARSLKGIADPRGSDWNKAMLRRCGFGVVESVFRNHCFEGYLAIKDNP